MRKFEFGWCPQCGGYHWNVWDGRWVSGCSLSAEEYEKVKEEAEREERRDEDE